MGQKLSCLISYYIELPKEPSQLEFLQPIISKIELCASSCNTNQKNLLERVTLIGFDEEGSTFFRPTLVRTIERRSHDETIIDETANNVRCGAGENLHESSQWYKSPLDDASLFQNFYWLSIYYRIGLKLCRIQQLDNSLCRAVVGKLGVQVMLPYLLQVLALSAISSIKLSL